MKILLVGSNWFGHWVDYCANALDKLGHDTRIFYWNNIGGVAETIFIDKFPEIPIVKRKIKEKWGLVVVNKMFIKVTKEYSPDLIFILHGTGNPLLKESLDYLKKELNNKIITWYGDDPFAHYQFVRSINCYDYIFAGDPASIPPLELIANAKIEYLPASADTEVYKPIELNSEEIDLYNCSIGFVGASHFNSSSSIIRGKVLESLREYDVKIYGDNGWKMVVQEFPELINCFKSKTLSAEETNKFMNAAKIIVNVHHPQNKYCTSIRTFEIASSQAFQLVENKPAIKELFEIDKEIVCFESIPELKEKAKYYLDNPKKRLEIAKRGRERVVKEHTYEHRMKRILNTLNLQ